MCNYSLGIYNDGFKEGFREGFRESFRESREDTLLSFIKSLVKNLHMTAEQAMAALGIPAEEHEKYIKRLAIEGKHGTNPEANA